MRARLALLLVCAAAAYAQAISALNLGVPMRDGVRLSTNVFRPARSGRFPTVLQRTPYGKVDQATPGLRAFLDHGYAVVSQDVRGRYDSEGEFHQYVQESADGEDTLSWIAQQPWSDSRVGMFGGSYVGLTQWRAALTGHPALKAIAPAVSGGDEYFDRYYSRGGALKLSHRIRWIAENFKPESQAVVDYQRLMTYLPLRTMDHYATGRTLDFFQAALDHPSYDDYWKALSTRQHIDKVKVPALIEGGWYDVFVESDFEMWAALRAAGKPARLVVGPWGHNLSPKMPEADFGPDAGLPLRRLEVAWFDAYVKGTSPAPASAVHYFVQGVNEWRESPVWPPASQRPEPIYLNSRKGANSLNGDGTLDWQMPRKSGIDRFQYDPKSAVPTVGGAVCCNASVEKWGPLDQRHVEGRPDVLVYSSNPLRRDLEVTGAVRVVLFVASDVRDTDFTAKLVDVAPDGRARILCDGILRLRYRQGLEKPVRYERGKLERIDIPTGVTSNVFRAGHRIRLEVASSNFPKYDRNLNTGRPAADEKEWRTAIQEVRHGKQWASYVLLPIVPRSARLDLVP